LDVKTEWDIIHNSREWGKWPLNELMFFISSANFNLPTNEVKILDAGCGNGSSMWYLLNYGYDTYGIDISSKAVERTNHFLTTVIKGFKPDNLLAGDLRDLPYPDNYFNGVVDICTSQCNQTEDIKIHSSGT
jgi:SAM-dependent methyltransferase